MPTTSSSTQFVRKRVLPRKRIVERAPPEQPLDRYLEALSLRHAKRTRLPLECARKQVEAVAISARRRHEGPLS